MKNSIIKNFNRGSLTYDHVAEIQKYSANILLKQISTFNPRSVLELGAGTGLLTKGLKLLYPKAKMTITDISPEMLAMCSANLASQSGITYQCCDIENMTLPFHDLVISNMVFHWLENLVLTLKKIQTSLSAHSKFIFSMLGEGSFVEWKKICNDNYITAPVPCFPHATELKKACPDFEFVVEKKEMSYKNLYEFLSALKLLGGNTTHPNYHPMTITKLRNILNCHNEKMTLTYEIIYGYYQNA